MLQYSTHLKYPDQLDGDFTIIYNANVGHRMFFEEWMRNNGSYQYQSAPHHPGYKFNAPEWIFGYKGIALQTLNFETNLFKPNYNLTNAEQYANGYYPDEALTIKDEVPLLIPGYSYTNKLSDRDYDNRNSGCLSTLPDIIQILRTDGSIIELENNELNKTEGLYFEKGVNKYGFAIVEKTFTGNGNVSRTMWYKPGDGLTYKFVEEFIKFGNCNNPDPNNSNSPPITTSLLSPTVMYLKEIISPANIMTFTYSYLSANGASYGRKAFQSLSVNANTSDFYHNEISMQYGYGTDNKMHSVGITNNNNGDSFKLELDAYTNVVEDLFSKEFYSNKTRRLRVNKIIDALDREDIITYTSDTNEDMIRNYYYEDSEHKIKYTFYLPEQINYFIKKKTQFEYYPAFFKGQDVIIHVDQHPQYSDSNMTYAKRDCFTNFMLKKRELFDNNNQVKTEQYSYTSDGTWTKDNFKSQEVNNIYTTLNVISYNELGPNDEFELFKNFTKMNSNSISGDVYDHGSRIALKLERKKDLSNTGKKIEKLFEYDNNYNTEHQSCSGRYYYIMETFYPQKITEKQYTNSTNISKETLFDYTYENLDYKWEGNTVRTKKIRKQQITTDPKTLKKLQTYLNIFPTADLGNYNENNDLTYFYSLQLPEENKVYSNSLIKTHTKNIYNLPGDVGAGEYAGRLNKTINHYGTNRETFNGFSYTPAQAMDGFVSLKENDKGVKKYYYYPTVQNGILKASVTNKKIVKTDGSIHDNLGFVHTGYQVKPFRTKINFTSPSNTTTELKKYTSYNRQNKLEFSIDYNDYYSDYFYDGIARIKNINLPGSFTSIITPFSDNYVPGNTNYEYDEIHNTTYGGDDDIYQVREMHFVSDDGNSTNDEKINYYSYFENTINPQLYNNLALFVEVNPWYFTDNEPKTFYVQGIDSDYGGEVSINGFGTTINITLPDSVVRQYINIAIDITSILNAYKNASKQLYGIKFYTISDPVNGGFQPIGTATERSFYFRGTPKCVFNYWNTANPNNYYVTVSGSEHSKSSYIYNYDDDSLFVFATSNFIKDENDNSSIKQKDEFDALGQLIKNSVKNSSNNFVAKKIMKYNYLGLPVETKTGTGVKTTNEYNFLGDITKTRLESLNPSTVEYNWTEGNITNGSYTVHYFENKVFKDADNKTRTEYFDKAGNKVAEKLGNNTPTIFQYNDIYQLVKVVSPEGKETTYEYDELGYLKSKTTPDENKYQYKYDKWGNLRFTFHKASGDPWNIYFNAYDVINRLITTGIVSMKQHPNWNFWVNDFGLETAIQKVWEDLNPDTDNNFFDETDENLLVVRKVYDNYTNEGIFSAVPPESAIDYNNYKGRLAETAFRDKPGEPWNFKIYEYNYSGNVKKYHVKYADIWSNLVNTYDHLGNLIEQDIHDKHFIWYYYDTQGRLITVKSYKTDATSRPYVHFSRDAFNGMIVPHNFRNLLTYNGLLANTSAKTEAQYSYNAADQITKLGTNDLNLLDIGKVDYTYNSAGRLKSIASYYSATPQGEGERRFYEDLNYYDNGNISLQTISHNNYNNWGDLTFNYTYDEQNRLTASDCSNTDYNTDYSYDMDGNFLFNSGLKYTYEENTNKLSSVIKNPDTDWQWMWRSYSYDSKGNAVSRAIQQSEMGLTAIQYFNNFNYQNLLTEASEFKGSGKYYYKYDEQGNRISKKFVDGNGNTQLHYFYFRDQIGKELGLFDTTNTAKKINLYGNGLIGYVDKENNDKRYYYIKDHLGSIRQVIHKTSDYGSNNITGARDFTLMVVF